MRLLLEFGNTRIKWVLVDDDGAHGEPVSVGHDDPSWITPITATTPDTVCYASVAAAGTQQPLLDWTESCGMAAPCRIVSTAHAGGVTNAYAEPSCLGVDRLLACVAAHQRFPGESVLVADAGTALTIDYVAADGQHEGGLICPGVTTMRHAIRIDTQVRAADRAPRSELLGRSTDAAVGQGTLQAALGLLARVRTSLEPAHLLITGGEAPLLAPYLAGDFELVPALVLEGLEKLSRDRA